MAFDLTNQRFGRLLVIKQAPNRGKDRMWECRCDCGHSITTRATSLRKGDTKSCGCLQHENRLLNRHRNITHGLSYFPEYKLWHAMHGRCYRIGCEEFHNYGARGISICERWHKKNPSGFRNFLDDMGRRPAGMSLDRINNDGNYEPTNCRWSTSEQQAANRRNKRIEQFTDDSIDQEFWRRKDLAFMANYVSSLKAA